MSLTVNDVLAITFDVRDTTSLNQFITRLHYRVHQGELPDEAATYLGLKDAFQGFFDAGWMSNLPTTVELRRMVLQKIAPVKSPTWIYNIDPLESPGGLTQQALVENLYWRMAATMTRVSYRTGRKAYGRSFFGPLLDRFCSDNSVVTDPTGNGDLGVVKTFLWAEQSVTVDTSTIILRPIVCPASGAGVDSTFDVRQVWIQPKLTSLRSRTPQRGG